ncbi:hypothetical protein AB0M36_13975 [Actinoplanes sp. NPDC051346]
MGRRLNDKLKDTGLIECSTGPHRALPINDVGYSIDHRRHSYE